jgi:CRISPR-associated exonuclease Cas4
MDIAHGELLPISALNALVYCPRSFYYQVIQGEVPLNEFVLEGQLAHRWVHQPGTHTGAEGEILTTRLYLASEKLRLSGFADVIEERAGMLIPVEYKRGAQGSRPGDQIQLCAQALCLEERLPHISPIPYGIISSTSSGTRTQVALTLQVRAETHATIERAWQIIARATPPEPLSGSLAAHCPRCGLLSLCLPEEMRLLRASKRR